MLLPQDKPGSIVMPTFYAEQVHQHINANPLQTLEKYRRRIKCELAKFGIDPSQLQDKTVLDIGSGWQAIVFQELGCKQIHHLDINRKHVEFLSRYCKEHGIENISSQHEDISYSVGAVENIDLAFVAGVYHHLGNREGFINNLLPAMGNKGEILFRVYRAGTWSRWLTATLRIASVGKLSHDHILQAYRLLQPYTQDNQFLGDMIDDLLTPQWLAFRPNQFLSDASRLGIHCQCLGEDFEYDFGAQDENFRIRWQLPANWQNVGISSLATGLEHPVNESPAPEHATLHHELFALMRKLDQHAPRDTSLVLVSLYTLLRSHQNVDVFRGSFAEAITNPNLASWRLHSLGQAINYFHDWLR
jgi:2-polyprenyl-3-methyl-5-hydroxy-6-metoxy-1,4-benzoquinol methylase